MKKKYTRFISFLLTLVIIVLCFPASVIATELEEQSLQPEILEEERKIVELEALREENVKHFSLPDGTYEAISYAQAVHRKDSEGVWQDINNDLSLTTVGTKQLYTTADMRVSYAKDFAANGELLTLSENGYYISMAMLVDDDFHISADDTVSRITTVTNSSLQRREEYDTLDEAAEIDNRSTVVYSNVINNTDIEYIMVGNDIKENIIVKSRADSYEYAFELRLMGLSAALAEEGYISLSDSESGEQKYLIPAPYMYDASYEYSNDVAYGLIEIGDGRYLLTVTANVDWINAEERAFPVKIDPTIQQDRIVYDTYVNASAPSTNYKSYTTMLIAPSALGQKNALVRITIPALPETATFKDASIYLKYYFNSTGVSMTVGAYRITEYWSDGSVNYNNCPVYNTSYMSTCTMSASSSTTASSPGTARFSITSAVRDWLEDSSSNFGIMFKYYSGSNTTVNIHSYQAGSNYAYISINYTNYIPDGVYGIRNYKYSNRWITTENYSSVGAMINHTKNNISPISATTHDPYRLFKITRVGTSSRYIIRLFTYNFLSLSISSTDVRTVEISTNDSDVPISNTFYFDWNGSGYTIRQYGSNNVMYVEDSTGSSNSGEALAVASKSTVGDTTKAAWRLAEYSVILYGIPSLSAENPSVILDTSSYMQAVASHTNSWKNITNMTNGTTAKLCVKDLHKANVFVNVGHGDFVRDANGVIIGTKILLQHYNSSVQESLASAPSSTGNSVDISQELSFDNLDLVIFASCYSGYGTNNLVTKIVEKGATVAVGFKTKVIDKAANAWIGKFFERLKDGYDVSSSIDYACDYAEFDHDNNDDTPAINFCDLYDRNDLTVCGNTSITLFQING